MNDGDVVLLENVRFNPEETSKDEAERAEYAKKIAALGDVFVSDGFGVVHRAQGSNYDVAADLPAAAGLLHLLEGDVQLGALLLQLGDQAVGPVGPAAVAPVF